MKAAFDAAGAEEAAELMVGESAEPVVDSFHFLSTTSSPSVVYWGAGVVVAEDLSLPLFQFPAESLGLSGVIFYAASNGRVDERASSGSSIR